MTVLLLLSVVSLAPWAGAVYAVLLLLALVLCRAARRGDELMEASRSMGPAAAALPAVTRPRSPQALVAEAVRVLAADDAALFGWNLGDDRLHVVATTHADGAASAAGRRLARQAFATGRLSVRPPTLLPGEGDEGLPATGLAVPASRAELRMGALCVTRSAARPFTARERSVLLRLGSVAADLLAGSLPSTPSRDRFSA